MPVSRFRKRDGLLVVVLLPVIVLLLPFTLMWWTVGERLTRCPTCGRRGGLHDVTPLLSHPEGGHGLRLRRSRIVRTRELACRHCGAHFLQPPGEPLKHLEPAA